MDRVLRNYAHTAWTPADPLAGLDTDTRRAILMMPSTFRERWKLAPWTDRHQRRLAIADIVAERRLLYELTHHQLDKMMVKPTPTPLGQAPDGADTLSAYYQYRQDLHRQTLASVRADRGEQDQRDIERLPEARADVDRRAERRRALLALDIERAKLDVKELEILADRDTSSVAAASLATRRLAPKKNKKKSQSR